MPLPAFFDPVVLASLWGALTGPSVVRLGPLCLESAVPSPALFGSASEAGTGPALAGAAAYWAAGPEAAAGATAFVDVNVVPMDTERVLKNQTVVVQNGHITALGPASQVKVPAGAVRVDGKGKYLMPGLGDMHTHYDIGSGESDSVRRFYRHRLVNYLSYGVTTLRHQSGFSNDATERQEQERTFLPLTRGEGKVLGPRIYYPAYVPLTIRPDSMAAAVAAHKAAGYRMITVSAWASNVRPRQRVAYDSLLAAAHRQGLVPSAHSHGASLEETVAFGAYGGANDHLWAFYDYLERPWADTSDAGYRAMAQAVQRAGTFVAVTLNCQLERQGKQGNIPVAKKIVKALQDEGARILLGSDAGDIGDSGNSVIYELGALMEAGLTPYQALVTSTRNVAAYFRLLDSSGTVAVGKRADLVLLHGNPLEHLRYTREPVGTMIAGRWLDRATLDDALLASPTLWIKEEILDGMLPQSSWHWQLGPKPPALERTLWEQTKALEATAVSDTAAYGRVVRELTATLGTLRELLTPAQRSMTLDPVARLWMRAQARRGYPVTVPGVPLTL